VFVMRTACLQERSQVPVLRQVAGVESRVAKSRARANDAILRFPMVPPWLATCSCGWVSAAQPLDELVILIDVHQDQASPGQQHAAALAAHPADWMPWNYRDTLAAAGAS
jgi:hypothetical protein